MSNAAWHLAQVNIGRARGEITDPIMLGFVARLEEINALAERSPGFVWRLQTEDGDATAVRPYPNDNRIMINMSAWSDLDSLREYVFRTMHANVMRQRREWFERFEGVYPLLGTVRLQLCGAVRSGGPAGDSGTCALGRRLSRRLVTSSNDAGPPRGRGG